jgi:hypothetical protein
VNGLAATIEKTSPDKICLRLSEAQILKMSGSAKHQVTISILGDEVQRRERST